MSSRADYDRLVILVHEVRSPVAALSAIAETLRDESVEPSVRRELAGLAVGACHGIERVVTDAAAASVRPEEVDVGRLVRETAAAAALEGARVRAEVAPALPLLEADPLRLRQALDNLVSNALTHSGSDAEVVVRAAADGDRVLLSVSDSGDGIPSDEQHRIFDPGVRLNKGRSGSGLGLAITRAIAEAHGGTLTVESVPGEGATFTLALPLPKN
jgi:two-component system sensor histidine kinase BaeS